MRRGTDPESRQGAARDAAMGGGAKARSPKAVRVRPVPAVKRSIDILFHLAAHAEPRSNAHIARDLGILPSSCLHILRELVGGGLVRFEPGRKTYALGPGLLTLAQRLDSTDAFVAVAQSHIDRIARNFRVKATASVHDGKGHVVVVATTQDSDDVHIHIPVGMRVPMLASATGRVVGAFGKWSPDELRPSFEKLRWQRPMSFKRWQAEVAVARDRGMAIDEGQYRKGISVLAAPIRGKGGTVDKFIGASALTEQLTSKSRRELAQALKDAADEIGRLMG